MYPIYLSSVSITDSSNTSTMIYNNDTQLSLISQLRIHYIYKLHYPSKNVTQ